VDGESTLLSTHKDSAVAAIASRCISDASVKLIVEDALALGAMMPVLQNPHSHQIYILSGQGITGRIRECLYAV